MTQEIFITTVIKLRDIINRFEQLDKLTGGQWTEGILGEMFDLFYDLLIPGANDYILEDFGEIIFANNITEQDIEDFYNEYQESLE